MNQSSTLIANAIDNFDELGAPVEVSVSYELIQLLSDQLYQSPLKAIEELVVNAYDADASKCRVYVPPPSDSDKNFAIVFDDGIGMDYAGLVELWKIGRSNKREQEIQSKRKRKQIGKFGIGKLATYAIANRLTYVTKSSQGSILSVTVDFTKFSPSPTGKVQPIHLPVRDIDDWDRFSDESYISEIFNTTGIHSDALDETDSWTIAILEDLKPKARKIKEASLKWVLSTAMPLRPDFRLYLNGQEIQSSKEDYEEVVTFDLKDLPEERLKSLQKSTGENWFVQGESLKSNSFASGITGTVRVTEKSLYGGKSDDLQRIHGFFIQVRGRLINEDDPLFGLRPLRYGTFNRLRANIDADDLDQGLKVSRDTVEESELKENFRRILREIFNEADARYLIETDDTKTAGQPKEGEKKIVSPYQVEYPIADALTIQKADSQGTEADEDWFYIEIDADTDLEELIQSLYTTPRDKFRYQYRGDNLASRLVRFNPRTSTFWLNQDHELVKEYAGDGQAKRLLEDFVTAEALLEIYLKESRLPPHIVGGVLEQRDSLLRRLVKDKTYMLSTIGKLLRDAATDANELEVMIVVAARGLGFVATHISGAGEPDGIARFIEYPGGEKKITLEAKSSDEVPSLSTIDFAGLQSHVAQNRADGCLLVAPGYPGQSKADNEVARRAQSHKISCWTVEQFAKFAEDAELRQFNARDLLDIVLNHFSPDDVTAKLQEMTSQPSKSKSPLYHAILQSLQDLEGRMIDNPRNIGMITTEVSRRAGFGEITQSEIRKAIRDMIGLSDGQLMLLKDDDVILHVAPGELASSLSHLTKQDINSRRISEFRYNARAD